MGRLQANYNSSKNNKISIKKQNLGGGTLLIKKKLFSFSSANTNINPQYPRFIDFSTSCFMNGEYNATAANPYELSYNVNLPSKPKNIIVKLNNIVGDDIQYCTIVLVNPTGKPCWVLLPNSFYDPTLKSCLINEAFISDGYPNGSAVPINQYITLDKVYTNFNSNNVSWPAGSAYAPNHWAQDTVVVNDGAFQRELGSSSPCPAPSIVYGFNIAGITTSRRFYYIKLNNLIDDNYNGIWKTYQWNRWGGDPSDVQNIIYGGIDLQFQI